METDPGWPPGASGRQAVIRVDETYSTRGARRVRRCRGPALLAHEPIARVVMVERNRLVEVSLGG